MTSTFAEHHGTRHFMWRPLKERVHNNRLHTTQNLKRVIQVKIALISQDQNLLQKGLDNSVDRLRQCIVH